MPLEKGRSNASSKFKQICDEVERLIRNDAHALISGNAGATARLIVAQLAHVHGMGWFEDMQAEQERTFKSLLDGKCGCHKCIRERDETAMHMVVCPICGNKRCPKATDHELACTNSNESGQAGSAYA